MLDSLKRRWYYFAPATLLLIPVLVMLYYMMSMGYGLEESWVALQNMGRSNTRYTQKYTESKFGSIQPGMDGRTVYQTMEMQPFEGQAGLVWKYSLPQGDAKVYHERTVLFERDKNNVPRVVRTVKRLHIPGAASNQ
jgi:hypothetical protein